MRDSCAFCLNEDFGFLLIPIFIHFPPKVTWFHFPLQLNKIPPYICTTFPLSFRLLFPLRLVPFLCYCYSVVCSLLWKQREQLPCWAFQSPVPHSLCFCSDLLLQCLEYTSRDICGCHHIQDVPVLKPLAPFSLPSNIPTLSQTRL